MAEKTFNIDDGFKQLDEILENLEREDIVLSDAIKEYAKGVEVLKKCKISLDQVEKTLITLKEDETKDV